jgi:Secretion system C-terminal sorting domain
MKTKLLFYLMLLVGLNASAQTINVSTGIDSSGNALSVGSTDPNWQIVSSPNPPGTPAKASSDFGSPGVWEPSPVAVTNARIINSAANCCSNLPGIYTFERSITISSGTTNLSYNFAVAFDDVMVSLELVRPDLTTIPLTFAPPSPIRHFSLPITGSVSNPATGTWKIRAVVNFIDSAAFYLLSGNVTISKTVCLPASKDAMIHEFRPTTNYGSNGILLASRWTYSAAGGSGFYTSKVLHQFDLSTLPVGAVITSAIMKLHVDTTDPAYSQHLDLGTGNQATVNQVGSAWGENTVTWNTAPSLLASSVAIPSLGNGSTSDVVANVTAMVQNMITTGVNNGFQISMTDNSDYYHMLAFASRENVSFGGIFQPELCITYTLPANTVTSQIQASQCGTTIPTLATTIRANWVTGVTNYRFRITPLVGGVPSTPILYAPGNGTTNFALSNVPGTTYNTQYRIEVEVQLNNVWQNTYGPACTVTTPNPISTIGAQCGTTLTAMNQWISTTIVPYVTSYRFRVTQLDGSLNPIGIQQIITSPHPSGLNKFNMTQSPLTGILFGTMYRVEVALRNTDGTYLPYNTGCNISTPSFPTSEVQLSQCDYNALSFSETIIASTVTPATEYRFLLYNTTLGYSFSKDRFVPNFTLSLFPGLLLGTTYSVQVAVKINGVWGPYGKICTLTTPAVFKMNVSNSNDFAFKAVAYPNPFASSFLIDVKTTSESQIQFRIYDMLGKLIEDKTLDNESLSALEIGSAYPTGIYNIIITQENNSSSLRVIKR